MAIHAIATYGDNLSPAENLSVQSSRSLDTLSPMRADIQNKPKKLQMAQLRTHALETNHAQTHPCLFLSTMPGATALTYVHVQIIRMMTSSSD